jgi:hypothetical protein
MRAPPIIAIGALLDPLSAEACAGGGALPPLPDDAAEGVVAVDAGFDRFDRLAGLERFDDRFAFLRVAGACVAGAAGLVAVVTPSPKSGVVDPVDVFLPSRAPCFFWAPPVEVPRAVSSGSEYS